jgi:AcrR family transcriptional regulator
VSPRASPAGAGPATAPGARRRVSAAERRDELIEAAVGAFASGGLHGTAVGEIARRVGVAQPYVFSLFPTKQELFIAAVERGFDRVAETFRRSAAAFERGEAPAESADALEAMGLAYKELLLLDRDCLMLQHQSYAACDEEPIRVRVRRRYAELVELVQELSGAEHERVDEFFRYGMALNVAAALGVDDLSCDSEWVQRELEQGAAPARRRA